MVLDWAQPLYVVYVSLLLLLHSWFIVILAFLAEVIFVLFRFIHLFYYNIIIMIFFFFFIIF